MKHIPTLIAIFVTVPIWFYLLYQILERVQATELMFFLFWIYVPATILLHVIAKLASKE